MRLIPTRRAGVFAALASCALLAATAPVASAAGSERTTSVIVQASDDNAAAALVREAGGAVTRRLPIVSGVAAELPASAAARLDRRPGVAVTPDDRVRVAETTSAFVQTDSPLNHVLHREVNADRLWSEGIDGTGVTVAVVDTGISPVGALGSRLVRLDRRDPEESKRLRGTARTDDVDSDGRRVVECVDFSATGTCRDQFGHGTFMGGLVAGGGPYPGVAPGARLLSVKIAGPDGSSDVSKVLAAIQWVVSFRSEYGVKVLNLSLGTDSKRHYKHDPLNHAVERAWLAGITVVVSAGNHGRQGPTISKPADDPLVITVGAVDDRETPGVDDDRSPLFSSMGPATYGNSDEVVAKPDVVAPGARVVSLRAPGSTIDRLPATWKHPVYRRGSGTSMSAAVVSGVAALLLDADPTLRPNRVKWALKATARKVAERSPALVGAGLVDASAALRAAPLAPPGTDTVSLLATEPGSIAESRGSVAVTRKCTSTEAAIATVLGQPCEEMVDGEETAQAGMWDAEKYAKGSDNPEGPGWGGSSWYESQWAREAFLDGSSWYETAWANGSSWYGASCGGAPCVDGSSWYGSSWYGSVDAATFYGVVVQGSSWYGAWG